MIQRRAVAGLALLGVFVFCVVMAQSALAVASKNTTAFTCISEPGGKGDFKDEHCDQTEVGKGAFTHQVVGSETKEVDATNLKVTESTKNSEPIVIKGEVALTKTEITCTTMKTATNKSFVHNVEPTLGEHTFTGNGAAEFSNCTVNKPLNCTINTPLIANATFEGVEGLEGPKGEKNAMGVRFVGAGGEETFAELTYEGASCTLKGKTFKVKGSAIGTSGPTTESAQENRSSGATIAFTPKFQMEEIKIAVSAAEVTAVVTPTGTGKSAQPISITTTT